MEAPNASQPNFFQPAVEQLNSGELFDGGLLEQGIFHEKLGRLLSQGVDSVTFYQAVCICLSQCRYEYKNAKDIAGLKKWEAALKLARNDYETAFAEMEARLLQKWRASSDDDIGIISEAFENREYADLVL